MVTNVLLIVTSMATAQMPVWKDVADALEAKHADEATVQRLVAAPAITDARVGIQELKPTHVAFVMRPEEVDFKTTVALKRLMRAIDDDPYDDADWGIVTGPTAADAKRIAASREPQAINSVLATTGVADDCVPGPIYCLSDANPPGCWKVKGADGRVAHHSTTNDMSWIFAEGWNAIDPDLIITSSHASQRNLEMPFSRGNIIPLNGTFVACPDLRLIDYRTGQAVPVPRCVPARGALQPLRSPAREKVWIAAGNCLIADNLRPGETMVMTALGFGKVNQFVGYISTTWFGEIGWGTLGNFNKGMSLVAAYHAANRKLIDELEETVANAKDFNPEFVSAKDYDRLMVEARKFKFQAKKPIANPQEFLGRLWDRDATVFYGDPMVEVYLGEKHEQ